MSDLSNNNIKFDFTNLLDNVNFSYLNDIELQKDWLINLASKDNISNMSSGPAEGGSSMGESSTGGPSTGGPSGGESSNTGGGEGSRNSPIDLTNTQFDEERKKVAAKLRDIYINRPAKAKIILNDPKYADKLSITDHGIICSHIYNTNNVDFKNNIDFNDYGNLVYKGRLTLPFLYFMEK